MSRLMLSNHRTVITVATSTAIALGVAGTATAQRVQPLPVPSPALTTIAPGVTYERIARPGGQVLHVVRTTPGATALQTIMAGGSPARTGNLREAVRARSLTSVAAVNGDFFNYSGGHPSGLTVIGNRLIREPEASRSAIVVGADGVVGSGRFALVGTWQNTSDDGADGIGPLRYVQGVNRPAVRSNETLLYTPDYGRATPTGPSRNEAVVRLDNPTVGLTPNGQVLGTVITTNLGGGAVPGNGGANTIVITGHGTHRPYVNALQVGHKVRIATQIAGLPDQAQAMGGGPLLVNNGRPVTAAGEGFTSSQLNQATSRTAIGQARDGGYLLVTVEGPTQGRRGVTNAQFASLVAGLGARVAVAMDAGGSSQMVVGSTAVMGLRNPRAISTALAVESDSVRIAQVPGRITPNADRVQDRHVTTVTAPSPGVLSVAMVRRGGGATLLMNQPVRAGHHRVTIDPRNQRLADGPYRIAAELKPTGGARVSTASRDMVLDSTLGNLTVRPFLLRANRRVPRPSVAIRYRLTRHSRIHVRVEDLNGRRLRVLHAGVPRRAGSHRLVWDRTVRRRIVNGRVRIVVIARSSLGTAGLRTVVRLAPPRTAPKRRP